MENNQLARFRYRLLASLLDGFIVDILSIHFALFTLVLFKVSDILVIILGGICLYYAFYVIFHFFMAVVISKKYRGKTMGKALVGIRVLREDNELPGYGKLFVRWFTYIFFYLLLTWIWIGITFALMKTRPLKQGLHDMIAKTYVVTSETSRANLRRLWIAYVVLTVLCIVGIIFSTLGLVRNVSSDLQYQKEVAVENAESLSGENGPLAEAPGIEIFAPGYKESELASEAFIEGDIESAKIHIDKAMVQNPKSISIASTRCVIYSYGEDSQEAFTICENVYKKSPNNPSLISNQIANAYYIGECGIVDNLAIALSNLRIGSDYDDETKSGYYGNTGTYLYSCEVNDELAVKMLEKAISLTANLTNKKYYQDYLDEYLKAE